MKRLFVSKHMIIPPHYCVRPEIEWKHKNLGEIVFFETDDSSNQNPYIKELFLNKSNVYLELLIRLDQTYFYEINLGEAKKQTKIPHKRFYKEFKEITNDTFANYLIRLRVYKIAYLLINTTIPIEKVAYDCGISSLSNYRKIVKEYLGMSPSEVRKNRKIFLENIN